MRPTSAIVLAFAASTLAQDQVPLVDKLKGAELLEKVMVQGEGKPALQLNTLSDPRGSGGDGSASPSLGEKKGGFGSDLRDRFGKFGMRDRS